MEDTVEGVLGALVVAMDVAVAAAGGEVVALDVHLVAAWAEPLLDQVRFLVGAEHGRDRGVEFPFELDVRDAFGCGDGDCVGHGASSW